MTGTTSIPTNGASTLICLNGILTSGDPSTIARFIIPGVIDASDHIFAIRREPDVSQECRKFPPRSVHPYTLGSVPFILWALWIVATLLDFCPTDIYERARAFGSITVCSLLPISSLAAAAFCYALSQSQRFYLSPFAADTSAKKDGPSFVLIHPDVFQHRPRTELLAGQINQGLAWHHPILVYMP